MTAADSLPTTATVENKCHLKVDRLHAIVRAIWRLLPAGLLIGAARLVKLQLGDLQLFWQQQPLACLALLILLAILGLVGLALTIGGLRWLLMAAWPQRIGLSVDDKSIDAAFGPFGRRSYPWNELECAIAEGFDADMLSQVGDDDYMPILRDARENRDVYPWLQSHCGAAPETLNRLLRPFLESRLRDE